MPPGRRNNSLPASQPAKLPYRIVDTGQRAIFSDKEQLLQVPKRGEPFFGQDGFYRGVPPSYRDNKDGTITDLNTGLMWQKTPESNKKLTFPQAKEQAGKCRLAGHDDWRLPTIKELYSLIDFNGNSRARPPKPYLDTKLFRLSLRDRQQDERMIDSQYWSAPSTSAGRCGTTRRSSA